MRNAKALVAAVTLLALAGGSLFANGGQEAAELGDAVPVMLWQPGSPQLDIGMVNEAAREYAGNLIGAYPVLQWIDWAEWSDRKELAISSGEPIDIIFTANWDKFEQHASRNAFVPLNDVIDEYAPSLHEILGAWLQGPVIDGKILAIPTMKENAAATAFAYNKRLVDLYDVPIDEITTPEELEPWLEVIKENEPNVIPFLSAEHISLSGNAFDIPGWTPLGDWSFFHKDGEAIYHWKRPEVQETARVQRDWFLAGYLPPEVQDPATTGVVNKYLESGDWFAQIGYMHPGHVGEWSNRWGYPIVKGPYWYRPITHQSSLLGAMHAVGNTSEKAAEAIQILELMNTDVEFNNLLNYGIEGVHYKVVDESVPYIERIPDSGYWPAMTWSMQNQFLTYLTVGEPADKWKIYREWNESATIGDDVGFFPDTTPVRTELATVRNVEDQYAPLLRYGVADVDETLDAFLDALEQAGVGAVEDELEGQFERFRAAQ
jgi:putative aldouronate transport system substrate-binding protein